MIDWWADDPEYPIEDWQYQVANGETRLGYHDWIENGKETRL